MAKRNTFREDEELEEQINLHDILRIGVYLKTIYVTYRTHSCRRRNDELHCGSRAIFDENHDR